MSERDAHESFPLVLKEDSERQLLTYTKKLVGVDLIVIRTLRLVSGSLDEGSCHVESESPGDNLTREHDMT